MDAIAIAAPILPGKLEEWKEFGRDLDEGSKHDEFAAFMKTCGVSRIRCWLQEGPDSATGIILYEGETPGGFLQQMASSQEPFAVWFRDRTKVCNGFDFEKAQGPPPAIVTDVSADSISSK